jgi:hypothetical protein
MHSYTNWSVERPGCGDGAFAGEQLVEIGKQVVAGDDAGAKGHQQVARLGQPSKVSTTTRDRWMV